MDNADGTIGTAVGITGKDVKSLVKSVLKELDRPSSYLSVNGISCLDYNLGESFVEAFLSWKGMTKNKRLEKYFRYFSFEANVKKSGEQYTLCHTYAEAIAAGKFSDIKRMTYSDFGGKTKA